MAFQHTLQAVLHGDWRAQVRYNKLVRIYCEPSPGMLKSGHPLAGTNFADSSVLDASLPLGAKSGAQRVVLLLTVQTMADSQSVWLGHQLATLHGIICGQGITAARNEAAGERRPFAISVHKQAPPQLRSGSELRGVSLLSGRTRYGGVRASSLSIIKCCGHPAQPARADSQCVQRLRAHG